MHTRTIGASQVLLAGVFWGTYGTFASFLPDSISPLAVGAIKLAIGAVGLAVILMVSHRGRIISKGTRFPIPTLLSCAVALAIAQTSIYMGVRNAGVTIATMIFIGTPPLFSGLFAQFVRKERQSLSWLVSSIIIALGCFCMAISGDTTADGNRLLIGSLFAATAGATWTFVGTNLRSMQKHATPLESSFVVMGAASLVLMPIVAFQKLAWIAEPGVFSLALAMGFVSTAIPYWLFTTGARRIPASHAFLYGLTEPITASFLGLVVLGERLASIGVVGYVLVIIGLVLFSLWEFRSAWILERSLRGPLA
ncbi:MAG: DMT family transporter [Sphaerochaetaceae bacterium]